MSPTTKAASQKKGLERVRTVNLVLKFLDVHGNKERVCINDPGRNASLTLSETIFSL